jgi:hypothetical protein
MCHEGSAFSVEFRDEADRQDRIGIE